MNSYFPIKALKALPKLGQRLKALTKPTFNNYSVRFKILYIGTRARTGFRLTLKDFLIFEFQNFKFLSVIAL